MPETETKPATEEKPEEKKEEKPPETDLDRLRSVLQKREADLAKKLESEQSQTAELELRLSELEAENAALKAKGSGDTGYTEEPPKQQPKQPPVDARVHEAIRNTYAERHAYKLALDYGGDPDEYKKDLLEARTDDQMERRASALEMKLIKGALDKAQETAKNPPKPKYDEGVGASAVSDIKREIDSFDPFNPEDRAKWQRERDAIRRKLPKG